MNVLLNYNKRVIVDNFLNNLSFAKSVFLLLSKRAF